MEKFMKRNNLLLIACVVVLLSLSMVFIACQENTPTPTPTPQEPKTYSITYEEVEGVVYSEGNPTSIKSGESVVFSFEVNVFYAGTPIVKVNDRERTISYDDETYLYSCTLNNAYKDIAITIEGISMAESALLSTGTGALESPFLIKEPVDLIKMAEVINSGAENSTMSVLGYYSLENDLDFHGEQIDIIGDGSTNYSFFGGYFNGNGHTISNFVIDTDSDYVGLFGIVQAYDLLGFTGGTIYNLKISDFTVTANNSGSTVIVGSMVGQGFGASMVLCEASNGVVEIYGDANHFSYAGGLIGLQQAYEYPYFSKVCYCSTTDVDVSCRAGTTFVAGGLVGYVYSADESVVATVTNCYTTGDVSGSFYAGGIVGWLGQYTSIVNCYALGDISAQTTITDTNASEEYCHAYAGGLVGIAQVDSAIVDSFASGKTSAAASLGSNYAHTGNLVGRIEEVEETALDSRVATVFNCYYTPDGTLDPTDTDQVTSKLYWHDIDWIFENGKHPVINSVNSSSSDGEIQHYTYEVTLDFGDQKVEIADGGESSTISISITDQYESMSFWYIVNLADSSEGMPETVIAKNGYTSYGFFFDKECTLAVPYGYVPTRNITLYGAFADYNEVAGTYYIIPQTDGNTKNNAISVTLSTDLSYVIEDAYGQYTGVYTYDGEAVLFYSARFAKYYGTSSLENQQSFTFKAFITEDKGLKIFGGSYVDEETSEEVYLIPYDAPLYACYSDKAIIGSFYGVDNEETYIFTFYANGTGLLELVKSLDEFDFEYSISGDKLSLDIDGDSVNGTLINGIPTAINGISLSATDKFRGTWTISSLSNKYYTFDGAGNWEYIYYGYVYSNGSSFQKRFDSAEGKYEVSGDKLILDNGIEAYIGEDGLLVIAKGDSNLIYGKENSYIGVWSDKDESVKLELNGLTIDGNGTGRLVFEIERDNGRVSYEIFEITYSTDTLNETQICIYYENEIYGILSFNSSRSTLNGTFYNPNSGELTSYALYRLDEYNGNWVNDTDPRFAIINFNGYGSYSDISNLALKGVLIINSTIVEYSLEEGTLNGYFNYNGERHSISYDEASKTVTISRDEDEWICSGKDILGDKVFIDDKNNEYIFNGCGHLSNGELVIGEKTYSYKLSSGENVAVIYDGENQVGTLTIFTSKDGRNYSLNINGESVILGEKLVYTGSWAISGYYEDLAVIGSMNLDNHVKAYLPLNINNEEKVHEADFVVYDGYIAWEVDEDNILYIVQVSEDTFVLSLRLNWFNYESTSTDETTGDETWNYSFLMTPDDLIGTWTNTKDTIQVYTFDGMGNNIEALGIYTVNGYYDPEEDGETFYYGHFTTKDETSTDYVVITSAGAAFKVVFCDYDSKLFGVYRNEETHKAFYLQSVDLEKYTLVRTAEDLIY